MGPTTRPSLTSPSKTAGSTASRGQSDAAFCRSMLPRVSRTFAVGIRLLPRDLEHSVLISYLLCRVADTIEDTTRLTPRDKIRLLGEFSESLTEETFSVVALEQNFADSAFDDELLAHHASAVLREFRRLPSDHQDAVRPWVQEMCRGMADFAVRSLESTADQPTTLQTLDELDLYCYYVAGTVGHLLTDLFRLQDPPLADRQYEQLQSLATSFGLGLQLTNIIKDVADDRGRGWIFVPQQLCQLAGITTEDVHDTAHRAAALRVVHVLINKAKGHLCDALDYSTTLPRRYYGVRLFCLTSFFFAVRTLRLAERDPRLLDPSHKVKISRRDVYKTIATARIVAPVNALVRRYFRHLAGDAWWRRYQTAAATRGA